MFYLVVGFILLIFIFLFVAHLINMKNEEIRRLEKACRRLELINDDISSFCNELQSSGALKKTTEALQKLEDINGQLLSQRDEARAVAEKYFNLYKELRSKELGAKMIRELKEKMV